MNFSRKHIILFVLVLGFFSFTTVENDISNHLQYIEYDLEESFDSSGKISDQNEVQDFEASGNGDIQVPLYQIKTLVTAVFLELNSTIYRSTTKAVKSHLFILFCCLKLDCSN